MHGNDARGVLSFWLWTVFHSDSFPSRYSRDVKHFIVHTYFITPKINTHSLRIQDGAAREQPHSSLPWPAQTMARTWPHGSGSPHTRTHRSSSIYLSTDYTPMPYTTDYKWRHRHTHAKPFISFKCGIQHVSLIINSSIITFRTLWVPSINVGHKSKRLPMQE